MNFPWGEVSLIFWIVFTIMTFVIYFMIKDY